MGHVTVAVGGRRYALTCSDGEEAHLEALAADLDAKATDLTAQVGVMSEARLLLMAGLQLADDLSALRRAPAGAARPGGDTDDAAVAALLARVEAIAAALDRAP